MSTRPGLENWQDLSLEERVEALRVEVAHKMVTRVPFVRTHGHASAPAQAYLGDAGFDLAACTEIPIEYDEQFDVPTGVHAALPEGTWGLIMPRSGVLRRGKFLVIPAVIDAGFRGELKILTRNVSITKATEIVPVGLRLAQIIVVPLMPRLEWVEQMSLPDGSRGERGFGSSGDMARHFEERRNA